MTYEQLTFDDLFCEKYKITKPIRLITTFSGYDSQALSLKYLGVKFEHYRTCEWAVKSIQALYDLHFRQDTNDYSKDLSKEQVVDYLTNIGISANYNDPMSRKQIEKLGEDKTRKIYNQIQAENNLVNIMNTKAEDLGIVDTDKYEYLLTYSFPCQDLSIAGKRKGMSTSQADGGTRSGLLWEIERILGECKQLPQILVMENVPEIIGSVNIKDFQKWETRLTELGYKNFVEILNTKEMGIPQNRRRCFMVSILDKDCSYSFPKPMKLEYRLKHLLEDNVDEKFYISDKMINYISKQGTANFKNPDCRINLDIARPITTDQNKRAGTTNYIGYDLPKNCDLSPIGKIDEWHQRGYIYDEKGISPTILSTDYKTPKLVATGNKALNETAQKLENIEEPQLMDCYNRKVIKDVSNTITTGVDFRNETFIAVKEWTPSQKKMITKEGNVKRYINSDIVDEFNVGDCADISFPNGYNKANRVFKGYAPTLSCTTIQDLIVKNEPKGIKSNLRIRKLTPRECGRLQGVSNEDISIMSEHQSNASLYHLYGDSITTTCLMGIFGELLGIDYPTKIREFVENEIIEIKENI